MIEGDDMRRQGTSADTGFLGASFVVGKPKTKQQGAATILVAALDPSIAGKSWSPITAFLQVSEFSDKSVR